MKKIYNILLLLGLCLSSQAQPFIGDVSIERRALEERDGRLYMDLDIYVHAKAMNVTQSWTIVPELSTADRQIVRTFPYLLVNGKNKRQMYERKIRFENTELLNNLPYMMVNVDRTRDTVFHYMMDVPYESWMDNAYLTVSQILTSCNERKQLFVLDLGGDMDREPEMTMPHVSFIIPDREEMISDGVVHYHLNKWEIEGSYMDNADELQKIKEVTDKMNRNSDINVTEIEIEGFASPEGPYNWNTTLSENRANELRSYIQSRLNARGTNFNISNTPEDWAGLRELVARSSISNRTELLAIIDSSDDVTRKEQRIKALEGGSVYRTLLRDILPQLRRAEYRISYTLKDYSDEEFSSLVRKNPEDLTQRELFLMAENYPQNSDEFNRVFNELLDRYPNDETANNNAAAFMLIRGENFSAKRYLDKAGNTPESLNNWGIYYLQTGDLNKAENMFKQAADQGVNEARQNLADLQNNRKDRPYDRNLRTQNYREGGYGVAPHNGRYDRDGRGDRYDAYNRDARNERPGEYGRSVRNDRYENRDGGYDRSPRNTARADRNRDYRSQYNTPGTGTRSQYNNPGQDRYGRSQYDTRSSERHMRADRKEMRRENRSYRHSRHMRGQRGSYNKPSTRGDYTPSSDYRGTGNSYNADQSLYRQTNDIRYFDQDGQPIDPNAGSKKKRATRNTPYRY